MKQKLLITTVIMLVVGTVGRIYANNYTYIDANGILRDTAWLPISTFLLLIGFLLLLAVFLLYGVGYLKNR